MLLHNSSWLRPTSQACLRHTYVIVKVPAVIIGPHLTSARPPCRRFLRARQFHVQKALDFFWAPCQARNDSSFVRFYENVDVVDYEETRKLVCHVPRTWLSFSNTAAVHGLDGLSRQAGLDHLPFRYEIPYFQSGKFQEVLRFLIDCTTNTDRIAFCGDPPRSRRVWRHGQICVASLLSNPQETESRGTNLSSHSHCRYLGGVPDADLEDQKLAPAF